MSYSFDGQSARIDSVLLQDLKDTLVNAVKNMLKEVQTENLRERRGQHRKPFVRPVKIFCGRDEIDLVSGFSRDLTDKGVGLISRVEWKPYQTGRIEIHNLFGAPHQVRAEVRWCKPYGDGWFLTGWVFLG